MEVCPVSNKGRRSVILLASRLGVSYQYVYKWIESGRIPAKYVKPIMELAKGRVNLQDILKFVI